MKLDVPVSSQHEPKQEIVPLVDNAFDNKVVACLATMASNERQLYGNVIEKRNVIYRHECSGRLSVSSQPTP